MNWWGKRKRTANSKRTTLSIEPLEDRSMMAAIPLVSGQAVTFQDADGTHVKVKLVGPGSGSIELAGGVLTSADIDSITLNDTTGTSKLKISTRGGTIKGTTINDLVINKAINEVGALKKLTGRKVDFLDGGEFSADGGIQQIDVRTLDGEVSIDGDVQKFKAETLDPNADVDVTGSIAEFVAKLLNPGSAVGANQIEMLKVKDRANGASVQTGAGGLVQAKIKNIYNSSISSEGMIGTVEVTGDALGAAFASNINMGSDQRYGTIDDFVVDRSAIGYINMVKLKGAVGGNGAEKVKIVSSGQVGNVDVSPSATAQGRQPMIWEQAASQFTPLSIVQASLNATGFTDDEIYVAIFGQELQTGQLTGTSYYLAPDTINTLPVLTAIPSSPTPGPTTPNLVTLSSYTLSDWADATQFWGSQLNFPTPPPSEEWTGRIVISAGAPVQAQLAADGSVNAPSPSDATDPSTGTFYDFIEFTITSDASGNPTLDADTSQVDSFGMPMSLQFWQPNATYFSGTIDTTNNSITGIANTAGLVIGQTVVGPDIPNGAMISGVTPSQGMTPGSISVNATLSTATTGNFTALTPPWNAYDYTFQGIATSGSNIITGVTNIQTLVTQQYFGFGQPVTASGILDPGTVVTYYDIVGQTITLNKNASGSTPSTPPGTTTQFTYEVAGPVGVEAERDEIMSQTDPKGLTNFLQQLVAGGNDQARPFLQSTAPFLANGPVPLSGALNNGSPIQIITSGTGVLQVGDQIEVDGVLGNTAANGVFQVASMNSTSITLGSPIGNAPYSSGGTWSLTGSPVLNTTTSQAVIADLAGDITTAGLQNGDTVTISGALGNTAVNGTFLVNSVTTNTFGLVGPVSTGASLSGNWELAGSSIEVPFTSTTAQGSQITVSYTAAGTPGLVAGDVVMISGTGTIDGNWVVESPTGNGFTLGSPAGTGVYTGSATWGIGVNPQQTYTVNGATRGGQVVVTTNDTAGLSYGDTVTVSNVVGVNAANGTFTVSNVTATTFALEGTLSSGLYISGGTWAEANSSTGSITGASDGPIVISTANTGNLQNGDQVTITGVQGNTAANGTFVVSNVVANTSFQLANPIGNATYLKDGTWSMSVTNALNMAVIQSPSTTGLGDGDIVDVLGVTGNIAVNGRWVAGYVTPTSFTLMAPVGNANYTTGGTWNLPGNGTNINITNVTDYGVPIVVTAQSVAGLEVGTIINIQNVGGNSAANGLFVVSAIDTNTLEITLGSPVSTTPYTTSSGTWTETFTPTNTGSVTYASTAENITIVTANTNGLVAGDMVEVMGVQGNSNANNIFYVTDITPVSFTLQGASSSGAYTLGGTWKQYASLNRLISPKDLTESIGDPADPSAINNYFNDLVDNFFLQYFSGTINSWTGGGQTFELVSTAYNGTPITYSGSFEQVTIVNGSQEQQYSGYALQLSEGGATPTDPNTYNIVYPWFNTNAPSSDIYSPLFGTPAPPTWIVSESQQFESASEMIFACDAVFADNLTRAGIDLPATGVSNAYKVLGDLENSLAAAFNRGIIMNDPGTWSDVTTWYPAGTAYNYWVQYWHQPSLTYGDLAYAFPYDDKFGLSTNLQVANAGLAQITLGSWDSGKNPVTSNTLSTTTTQPVTQQGLASFTATIKGSNQTPAGQVAFFLDGIALNEVNNSSSPPLQLKLLSPTMTQYESSATINVNLPPTSDAGNEHTYTVTAVYTGDGNFLPSVSTMQLQIAAS